MHNFGFALDGAWRVLVAGLVLGAGLPGLFALGLRALGRRATRPIGYGLFGVVVLGVLLGLTFIVASGFGKALSFEHVFPAIVAKH